MSNDIPKVGDHIYVDTSLFVTHGEDDFIGGLCRVCSVKDFMIEVEEDPGAFYNWHSLREEQESLKKQFGNKRGYKKRDHRDEFNSL